MGESSFIGQGWKRLETIPAGQEKQTGYLGQ